MICSLGQVNGLVASLLYYSLVVRIGSCRLVLDASALFHKKVLSLEKVQILRRIKGLVV
jgi:hypothetical protein